MYCGGGVRALVFNIFDYDFCNRVWKSVHAYEGERRAKLTQCSYVSHIAYSG